MASVTVKVEGLQALGEQLRNLSAEMATSIASKAVSKAAKVVQKTAITYAPLWPESVKLEGVVVPPGNLKKNIVTKKIKSPLTAEYIVTVRGKKKDFYAARYGRLVEYGTVKMPANSFLRKAFEEDKRIAVTIMATEIEEGIKKQVLKTGLGPSIRADLGIPE